MGTFQDKTSMGRILFAVFTHENKSQGVSTLFLLTQNEDFRCQIQRAVRGGTQRPDREMISKKG
jgi:hypothetical protein